MFEKNHTAIILTLAAILLANATPATAADRAPDLVLRGTIASSEHQTYRQVPFEVPAGVESLEVRFDYTGREERTVIDLGLLGPGDSFHHTFRGWSGGNKRSFTVGADDATPSYLSGPVTPGTWNLLLGIPNIRAGQRASYTAEIRFAREGQPASRIEPAPLRAEAGWYRGDLHMHSGHSDGNCASRSGRQRGPCPLFLTLNQAAERGLNFVAVTEHNTISHLRDLTAMQPYFDDLLLIPGMEVTTFQGHANAFDVREPIDFRVTTMQVPDWNALLATLRQRAALVSINHPKLPSGEACMGCGWTPQPPVDPARVQAVEAVNGIYVETAVSGLPFWHDLLQKGYRPTGIGGSDTHDPTSKDIVPPPARIGVPTTVVHASSLSTAAILEGIRSGRVFIDTAGTRDRILEFSARVGDRSAVMGGAIAASGSEQVELSVQVQQVAGGRIEIIRDGAVLAANDAAKINTADYTMAFAERGDGRRHWIRINVRDGDGRLVLVGNPIYFNWKQDAAAGAQ